MNHLKHTLLVASALACFGSMSWADNTTAPKAPSAASAAQARYESDQKLCNDATSSNARLQCRRDAKAEYDKALSAAKADQFRAHVPEQARLQLEPHQEQHHDHAELGVLLQGRCLDAHQMQRRADDDAGDQIAQHAAQPQPRGNGHGDRRRDEIDQGLGKYAVHKAELR